jgi:hypothetical protein
MSDVAVRPGFGCTSTAAAWRWRAASGSPQIDLRGLPNGSFKVTVILTDSQG